MPNVLSQDTINQLSTLVAQEQYTSFYELLYLEGSAVSALYIPGPTGQGIFGNLSHFVVSESITAERFEELRPTISNAIANGLLSAILATEDDDGRYRMLTDAEFLAEEIRIFGSPALSEIPIEAYPGHDLIALFNIDNTGSFRGATFWPDIGSAASAAQSLGAAIGETYQPFPILNNQILTLAELLELDGSVTYSPSGIPIYRDEFGNILETRSDVFNYRGVIYSGEDLENINGILYDTSGSFNIPLGISNGLVVSSLFNIYRGHVDLRDLGESAVILVNQETAATINEISGTAYKDVFEIGHDYVNSDVFFNIEIDSNTGDFSSYDFLDASLTSGDYTVSLGSALIPGTIVETSGTGGVITFRAFSEIATGSGDDTFLISATLPPLGVSAIDAGTGFNIIKIVGTGQVTIASIGDVQATVDFFQGVGQNSSQIIFRNADAYQSTGVIDVVSLGTIASQAFLQDGDDFAFLSRTITTWEEIRTGEHELVNDGDGPIEEDQGPVGEGEGPVGEGEGPVGEGEGPVGEGEGPVGEGEGPVGEGEGPVGEGEGPVGEGEGPVGEGEGPITSQLPYQIGQLGSVIEGGVGTDTLVVTSFDLRFAGTPDRLLTASASDGTLTDLAVGFEVFAGAQVLDFRGYHGSLTSIGNTTFDADDTTLEFLGVDDLARRLEFADPESAALALLTGGQPVDSLPEFRGLRELSAGTGDDTLNAGLDDFDIYGGIGDDELSSTGDGNSLIGGSGNDTLTLGPGGGAAVGGSGDDNITLLDGGFASGGSGTDVLNVSRGSRVTGDANDTLIVDGITITDAEIWGRLPAFHGDAELEASDFIIVMQPELGQRYYDGTEDALGTQASLVFRVEIYLNDTLRDFVAQGSSRTPPTPDAVIQNFSMGDFGIAPNGVPPRYPGDPTETSDGAITVQFDRQIGTVSGPVDPDNPDAERPRVPINEISVGNVRALREQLQSEADDREALRENLTSEDISGISLDEINGALTSPLALTDLNTLDPNLLGTDGNDQLVGSSGADIFVTGSHIGNDTVLNFLPSDGDVLDVSEISGLSSSAQLILEEIDGGAIRFNSGTATVVRLDLNEDGVADDNQSVTVIGVTASELTADAFSFAFDTTPSPVPTQVGTTGDDNIAGTNDDDVIDGGVGSDTVVGNLGDDYIIYSGGDDVIGRSNRGNDTVDLSAYAASEVKFSITGHDVLIETPDGTIELEYQVRYELGNAQSNIEEIIFADGTLDAAGIQGRALADQGTADDDFVTGSYQNDTINAGLGNDTIRANSGDDVIVYEGGNDFVHRSNGDTDTLNLSGYAASDVSFSVSGHNVIVTTPDGTVELDYQVRYEVGNSRSNIEGIVFSDGTLDEAGIHGRAISDQGTAGNDTVTGSYQNDTINAGVGNDEIRAYAGDDFIFYTGGNDSIHRSNTGFDTLDLSDYHAADVVFSQDGHDVLIQTTDGTIELDYQVRYDLGDSRSNIEEIVFADAALDEIGIRDRVDEDALLV